MGLLLALVAPYIAFAPFLFPTVLGQQGPGPVLNFNPISVQLDSTGTHRITSDELAQLSAGSTFIAGLTDLAAQPEQLTFCDVGYRVVTLTLTDLYGLRTTRQGPIEVLAPTNAPLRVYVDAAYSSTCGAVGFPASSPKQYHLFGFDAFSKVQAAIDHVTPGGVVYIAPATYVESVTIDKPLFLLGPNAGIAGLSSNRKPEARIVPARNGPENGPIISVESDDVVIDGLLLDGHNPQLTGGYDANGVRVHAAAGVQNGTYPDLADVEGISIRNNIITNISYRRHLLGPVSVFWHLQRVELYPQQLPGEHVGGHAHLLPGCGDRRQRYFQRDARHWCALRHDRSSERIYAGVGQ